MDLQKAIDATHELTKAGKVPVAIFCSPITMAELAAQAGVPVANETTISGLPIYADPEMDPKSFDVAFDVGEAQRRLGLIRMKEAAAKLAQRS